MKTDFNPSFTNIPSLGGFNGASENQRASGTDAESKYRSQNRAEAEDRNMLRSGSDSRREDRNGVTIRSSQGDSAEFSYSALNAQKSAINVLNELNVQ